ncbi:MAG: hypothetical protein WA030_03420 [Candidatus Microsaccharimonas sp.]
MDDIKAKQQIVEKIKASTNILVTVSNDPSVDALSAAIGLTLLLDKLEKHPTAVFSGATPPAIAFLEPDKVLDDTTDSLRDFIIALDKEKADHLRYKVEGDAVKIFITPYKTTISSDDLEFSQGDFNVELVIALGVDNQDHLDGALEAQGQILHDATIITATAGEQTSTLGGIDWHDTQSSSLSEMIAGLAEALKTDKTKSLLDGPIATAFLTGIVAETDRFSNTHTTARVMTVAAQLMAAGADQQLIASKLQEGGINGEIVVSDDNTTSSPGKQDTGTSASSKDTLDISHHPKETLEEMDKRVKAAEQIEVTHDEPVAPAADSPSKIKPSVSEVPVLSNAYAFEPEEKAGEPELGGTLSATTEQAADDARRDLQNDQNKTILTHSYVGGSPNPSDVPPSIDPAHEFLGNSTAAGSMSVNDAAPQVTPELVHSAYAFDTEPTIAVPSTAAPIAPLTPTTPPTPPAPADLGLPMPPPIPDFSQSAPAPLSAYAAPSDGLPPERLGDILAPEPPTQPSTLPPLSPTTPPPSDPGQFKIPGQQ